MNRRLSPSQVTVPAGISSLEHPVGAFLRVERRAARASSGSWPRLRRRGKRRGAARRAAAGAWTRVGVAALIGAGLCLLAIA